MTVAPVTPTTKLILSGASLGPFPTSFPFEVPSDVTAWLDTGAGATQLNPAVDYVLSAPTPLVNGGTVTLNAALLPGGAWPGNTSLVMERGTSTGQPTSLDDQAGFQPSVYEASLDHLARQIQDLDGFDLRTLRAPAGEFMSNLPAAEARASHMLAFDTAGNPVIAAGTMSVDPSAAMFSSAVAVGATPIAAGTLFVRTAGYYAAGDGGAALYAHSATLPSVAHLQSADGAYWVLSEPHPTIFAFGAKGDGVTDDSAAFQAAANYMPAAGGQIDVPKPPVAYNIVNPPSWGTKSVFWNISVGASFTGPGTGGGVGKFPAMGTNYLQLAVGPWIQSKSTVPSPSGGGLGALNVEMLQPAGYNGIGVGIYAATRSASPAAGSNAGIWAANFLANADAGFAGNAHGIEIDVNNSSSATGQMIGLLLEGIGAYNVDFGILMARADSSKWVTGLQIQNTQNGIILPAGSGLNIGIIIGNPTTGMVGDIIMRQLTNGGTGIIQQRNTDTSPNGYFQYGSNAANSQVLYSIDVFGHGYFTALHVTTAASAGSAGELVIGASTATVASAGGAVLPAAPLGFLLAYVGATPVKIPYYGN